MKRYLLAIFLLIVIVAVMIYFMPTSLDKQLILDQRVHCAIYCKQTKATGTCIGNGYVVECDGANFYKVLTLCSSIDGVSFRFDKNNISLEGLLQKFGAQTISCQQLGDLVVICGYSPKISNGLIIDGKNVNLQIAVTNQTITVGSPLILGSY